MLDRYKVFSEQHNKILDLVEIADEELANKYKKFISSLPDDVYDLLETKKKFAYQGDNCKVVLDRFDNMLEFEQVRQNKYLCTSLNIYTYYADELTDEIDFSIDLDPMVEEDEEDRMMFLFSMTMSNTTEAPYTKIEYEERDGKYVCTSVKLDKDQIEIDYEVFIDKRDEDDFYLICNKTINGINVYSKEVPISLSDLMDYSMEDEIEDYPDEDEDEIDFTEISFDEFLDEFDQDNSYEV